MKTLKRIAFALLGLIVVILVAATILEKLYGTQFVTRNIYGSPAFVALWAVFAVSALVYMIRSRLYRRVGSFMIHVSFLVILAGALTTYIWGAQGTMHLRKGESTGKFLTETGPVSLPFAVTLEDFEVIYYAGTPSPMDYMSTLSVTPHGRQSVSDKVSMNNIMKYKGYRFYQSGYDADEQGATLSVSHDPVGIAVTYTGYALLLISMVGFFFLKNSRFRVLLRKAAAHKGALTAVALLMLSVHGTFAAEKDRPVPKVLPKEVAAQFGDLHVLYNNRICPLQTVAKDFTTKLYGKSSYRGMTAEQVFTGWMFYYSSWKSEPMIKTKGKGVRALLGIEGKYAALDNFIDKYNSYTLDDASHSAKYGKEIADRKGILEADEKYNIVRYLYSGKMLKIFPYEYAAGQLAWYAQGDDLPVDMNEGVWVFIRKTQDYLHEMVVMKDYDGVAETIVKIGEYQRKTAADVMPSARRFRAEKIYNSLSFTRPLAMGCATVGIVAFMLFCLGMVSGHGVGRKVRGTLTVLLVMVWAYLTATIILRCIVSGHIPLSNGYETMQFMAWCSLVGGFFLRKRAMFLPFGFLLCGLTLLVSMMGESNPQVTQLVPVLSSPLLSIHVAVIMIAYSLFAFMMLNGVAALVIYGFRKPGWQEQVERLEIISRLLLYPAVFCLAAGIFVGAVWANVSWGRYWGWDPKEVWALITLLVYGMGLHGESLSAFRRPMFFHVFCVIAFLCVLATYFGVNFILGGMHSYA